MMNRLALMRGGVAGKVRSILEHSAMQQPDDVHRNLLKLIEREPHITQREAARRLGVSVGKINYCLRALVARGYVKLGDFRRQTDKRVYRYMLTSSGIEEKARITLQFLQRKTAEYDRLRREIRRLRTEVKRDGYLPEADTVLKESS